MDLTFQIPENPLQFWLLIIFSVVTIIQLFYFWGFFSRLAFFKPRKKSETRPPVSVVITANNQYRDLRQNLSAFLSQDYPEFEVVVVIDNSDDGTDELLQDINKQHSNLHVVKLTQNLNWFSGRKFALSLGIKSAKHDHILLSEPGCKPAGSGWISAMASSFNEGKEIITAYASAETSSGLNKWLRFAAFYDALFYLSMALAGSPFKGSGKNLAYTRTLFYQNKGFSSHYAVNAGDDELFVNKASNHENTGVEISPESKINHVKKITFGQWLKKERTRLRIRRYFKFRDRLIIRTFSFTAFLFYPLLAGLLILQAPFLIILLVFMLRFLSQLVIFGLAQKKLTEKNLWYLSPVFELFIILIDFLLWLVLLFSRGKKWE